MELIQRPHDRELVRRACDVLLKIPGVFSVGLGSKLVNGQSTGQLALSILVLEKKSASALAPHEVIPDEIEGLPTDVLEAQPPRPLADEEEQEDFDAGIPRDEDEYRPIVGGIQIRGANSIAENRAQTFGTLGGFAKTTGSDPGRHVLLTNHHVLDDQFGELNGPSCTGCTKGDSVGNPNVGSQIATVLRGSGKDHKELDAAIAILDKGVEFQRDIVKDDEPSHREAIGESRPLETTDKDLAVHKRGMRSRITYGIVGAVSVTTNPPIEGKTKENQIRIDLPRKVTASGSITFEANNTLFVPAVDFTAANVQVGDVVFLQVPPNDGRYRITQVVDAHRLVVAATPELEQGTGSHSIMVTPPMFALKGDSGSLLLDPQRRVVGLVWAANTASPFGNAWANRIEVVESQLQIKIDSAATVGDTQVALSPFDAGDAGRRAIGERLRPAAAAAIDGVPPPVSLRTLVEGDLLALPRGRQIYQLYFKHHMEIRELIDSNRRVATVWHRQGGPGMIQTVVDAVRSRTTTVPASIRGKSWGERVGAILAVFEKFSSSRLREDIATFGRDVETLGGMTYPGFLENLKP